MAKTFIKEDIMDTIKINSGVVQLEIDCDGVKDVISFNPDDLRFVQNSIKYS